MAATPTFDPSDSLTTEELSTLRSMANEHGVDYAVWYDPVDDRRIVIRRSSREHAEWSSRAGGRRIMAIVFASPRPGTRELEELFT